MYRRIINCCYLLLRCLVVRSIPSTSTSQFPEICFGSIIPADSADLSLVFISEMEKKLVNSRPPLKDLLLINIAHQGLN